MEARMGRDKRMRGLDGGAATARSRQCQETHVCAVEEGASPDSECCAHVRTRRSLGTSAANESVQSAPVGRHPRGRQLRHTSCSHLVLPG